MDIMSYLMGQNSAIKKGMKVEVVTELPETGEGNTVYLVPKQSGSTGDLFDEYLYINNAWEHIGSADIDLSDYYTKSEVDDAIAAIPTSETTIPEMKAKAGEDYACFNDSEYEPNILYIVKPGTKVGYRDGNNIAKAIPAYAPPAADTYLNNNFAYRTIFVIFSRTTGFLQNIYNTQITIFGMTASVLNNQIGWSYIQQIYWSSSVINRNEIFQAAQTTNGKLIGADNLPYHVLTKTNTTSYTPTSQYHPATKKYVDDSITSAITDALGGNY